MYFSKIVSAVVAVIGLCFAAISANAADPFGPSFNGTNYTENALQSHSWTGVYFGGGLGYQIGTTDLDYYRTHKNNPDAKDASSYGLSSDDWRYGLRIGFDYQPSGSPFVIGVFGGHDWGESDFSAATHFDKKSTRGDKSDKSDELFVNGRLEPTWYVGGRVGITPTSRSLVYVGYAYSKAKLDFPYIGVNHGWSKDLHEKDNKNTGVEGHTFLAGVELALSENLSAGLEYNYTKYDSLNFAVRPYENPEKFASHFSVDPEVHSVMLRLNWRIKGVFQ